MNGLATWCFLDPHIHTVLGLQGTFNSTRVAQNYTRCSYTCGKWFILLPKCLYYPQLSYKFIQSCHISVVLA